MKRPYFSSSEYSFQSIPFFSSNSLICSSVCFPISSLCERYVCAACCFEFLTQSICLQRKYANTSLKLSVFHTLQSNCASDICLIICFISSVEQGVSSRFNVTNWLNFAVASDGIIDNILHKR